VSTSPTSKLGIALPVPGSGEPYTVSGFNAMITSLDTAAGFTICTSGSRPASPYSGQSIFETDTLGSFVWDGSAWQAAGGGGSIEVSSTAPASPGSGDLWWDSDDGKLYIYYDDGSSQQWVDAAGSSVAVQSTAPTGYEGQLWLDDTDGSMYVYYTDPGGGASSWIGAVSRSGGILQVVSTTKTDTYSESLGGAISTAVVTGLTASITPRSTSSKILVKVSGHFSSSGANGFGGFVIRRDSTAIGVADSAGSRSRLTSYGGAYGNEGNDMANLAVEFLDSPATTSSITYGISLHSRQGGTLYVNRSNTDTDTGTIGRTVSTITLIEVAG